MSRTCFRDVVAWHALFSSMWLQANISSMGIAVIEYACGGCLSVFSGEEQLLVANNQN